MLKRHAVQVLRQAGHDQADVTRLIGVGGRTVRRVDNEPDVTHVENVTEWARRAIGRPAKAESYRSVIMPRIQVAARVIFTVSRVEHGADSSRIALQRITEIAVAASLGRAAILVHHRASADWSRVNMPQLIRITRDPVVMGRSSTPSS